MKPSVMSFAVYFYLKNFEFKKEREEEKRKDECRKGVLFGQRNTESAA